MSDDKTKKSIKKKITNTVKKAVKKVKGAPKRATWKLKKALANKQAINYETKSGKPLHLVRASLGYRNNTTAKNQKTEMLYRLAKMNLNNTIKSRSIMKPFSSRMRPLKKEKYSEKSKMIN